MNLGHFELHFPTVFGHLQPGKRVCCSHRKLPIMHGYGRRGSSSQADASALRNPSDAEKKTVNRRCCVRLPNRCRSLRGSTLDICRYGHGK